MSSVALTLLVVCAVGKIHSMIITFLNRLAFALSNRNDIYSIYTALTPWAQIVCLFLFIVIVVVSLTVHIEYLKLFRIHLYT